eukprot:CAMPEP_0204271018 /NCGR_PEP_ID=MMETSP0468-20130131/19219_1 /ASSEMBLY_ACC=CAM_ASM_000383 /TAXON_ID=2969 /ORGANISM="Oxyrrhis marina" /LENGTH=60 /DNA_ID=CAMNT_0051246621 /DNA_START=177 /DNA_END=359 /DNA_ORIENTATION=+
MAGPHKAMSNTREVPSEPPTAQIMKRAMRALVVPPRFISGAPEPPVASWAEQVRLTGSTA